LLVTEGGPGAEPRRPAFGASLAVATPGLADGRGVGLGAIGAIACATGERLFDGFLGGGEQPRSCRAAANVGVGLAHPVQKQGASLGR